MKRALAIVFVLTPLLGITQPVFTVDSAIAQALRFHPLVQAADWNIKQQQALKAGSFSLPDPEIIIESPSSEYFTVGAQQSFDNPLVYVRQSQLGRERIQLSRSGRKLSVAFVQWQAITNGQPKLPI